MAKKHTRARPAGAERPAILIRDVDGELRAKVKARAALEGYSVREVVLRLLASYAKRGLPKGG